MNGAGVLAGHAEAAVLDLLMIEEDRLRFPPRVIVLAYHGLIHRRSDDLWVHGGSRETMTGLPVGVGGREDQEDRGHGRASAEKSHDNDPD